MVMAAIMSKGKKTQVGPEWHATSVSRWGTSDFSAYREAAYGRNPNGGHKVRFGFCKNNHFHQLEVWEV